MRDVVISSKNFNNYHRNNNETIFLNFFLHFLSMYNVYVYTYLLLCAIYKTCQNI